MKVSAVLLLGVLLGGCCMLAAADEATWANANCDCTRERAIVCGDDGTSYLNKCWAECSGAKVAHDGACHKLAEDVAAGENIPCPCTKERAIVCGADGHSYTNACWAACAQTDVVHQGPCSRALELPPCACTTERALVCGADGHSYTNACWASCSGTSVAHDGACKKATTACDCSKERAIVCGDDGHSYLNKCWAECSGAEVAHDGACQKTALPVNDDCGCHGWSRILCGADGKMYANECTMKCAGVESPGYECKPCITPRALIPTCGKDGITYYNPWELECTGVEKDHLGPCEGSDFTDDMLTSTECQKACPPVFEPVCGMNNKSYANKCRMECDGVELKHEGRCPINPPSNEAADEATTSCDCSKERAIVCGDDGHSYLNKCWAECSGAEVAHDGACKKTTQPTVNEGCNCHGWANPICGADGKYYGNGCTLECAGVEEGSGCEPCITPRVYLPTCGKDGLTYPNPWILKCTGVEQDHPGSCEADDFTDDMLTSTECQKACAPVFEPVCGMNNKSYANKCRMECDGVELKHEGRCPIQTI